MGDEKGELRKRGNGAGSERVYTDPSVFCSWFIVIDGQIFSSDKNAERRKGAEVLQQVEHRNITRRTHMRSLDFGIMVFRKES